jgi:hypothetical protein
MDEKSVRRVSRTRAVSLTSEAKISITESTDSATLSKSSGNYLTWEMNPRRESEASYDSTASKSRYRKYKIVIPNTGVLMLDHVNTSQLFS